MQVPLELSFRNVEKTDDLEGLIREKAHKLEQVCSDLVSCRVAVERPNEHPRHGSPFRVRIDMGVPPGHEIVIRREAGEGAADQPLTAILREAFDAATRQLRKTVQKRRSDVKTHPQQEVTGLVRKLFPEEGYGFIETLEGREIYFHRNSVLHEDFGRLTIGTGVRFVEEQGEEGAQASTVQLVDKPGHGG